MVSCLTEILVGTNGLEGTFAMLEPGLILGQALKWLPAWLTPLWLIAVGLAFGAIAAIVVYGVLAVLSFIPGLGDLADSPRRGVTASLIVGGVISAGLCAIYVPQAEQYAESPLLAVDLHRLATWFWSDLWALASDPPRMGPDVG